MTKAFPALNDEASACKYPSDETLSEVLSSLSLGTVKVEGKGSGTLSKEFFWGNPILAKFPSSKNTFVSLYYSEQLQSLR